MAKKIAGPARALDPVPADPQGLIHFDLPRQKAISRHRMMPFIVQKLPSRIPVQDPSFFQRFELTGRQIREDAGLVRRAVPAGPSWKGRFPGRIFHTASRELTVGNTGKTFAASPK